MPRADSLSVWPNADESLVFGLNSYERGLHISICEPSGKDVRNPDIPDKLVRRDWMGKGSGVDSTELPADPFARDVGGLVQSLRDGLLLWDSLRSYQDVRDFFNALDALEADDLRKVVLAVRALAVAGGRAG